MKLQLIFLLVSSYWITGLISEGIAIVGSSCELTPEQNGTCSRIIDCPYAKSLINKRQRPKICEFIGKEPVVCCPPIETSKDKNKIKTRSNSFKRQECTMIVLGGRYEPPGMTDRPTKMRHKIIDYDGLPPPLPQPSILPPPLPLLPLSYLPPLPPPPPPESYLSTPISRSEYSYANESSSMNGTVSDLVDYLHGSDLPPPAIAGGIRADTAEFPHMARLGVGENKSNISWYCGGSLISDKFILTAAHCIYSQYGTINWARLGDPVELRYVEFHEVANNILHPNYSPFEHYHDIALSELKDKVEFNFYINPACVYTELEIPKSIRITVSGWGATGFGEEGSEDLLKADLDMYTYEECAKRYPKTLRKLPRGLDNKTHICAGGRDEVKDTCQGDSGGPLQIRGANETFSAVYSVIGVTSFGKICGFVNQPGVYIRIYPYLQWIESEVWKTT